MHWVLVLCALIIVAVLILVWAVGSDDRRRRTASCALDNSIGVYDAPAVEALEAINQIDNPTIGDHFTRAGILHYNLLEGNLNRPRGHQVARLIAQDMAATLTGLGRGEVDEELQTEYMIAQMEGFGHELAAANHDFAPVFNNMVGTAAPAIRRETVEQRRGKARAGAKTLTGAAELAIDDATKYTNDRQNVHDSHVNRDLRSIFKKMRSTRHDDPAADPLDDVEKFIRGKYAQEYPEKSVRAARILDIARTGEHIGTFNDTENEILATVWERCKHPRNRKNRDLMFEAVANSLADSLEDGKPVCINGRTGRVLNSLATLDFDSSVSDGAMTLEAYRNQIFQESKEIITREIARASRSADPAVVAGALAYDRGDDAPIEPFTAVLKQELHTHVDSYSDKLSDAERENIKSEVTVYAAAD